MKELQERPADPGCNLRDLGECGRLRAVLRKGVLYRSDALSGMPESTAALVSGLGLTCVVDLRSREEIAAFPCDLADRPGTAYHHVDLAEGFTNGAGFDARVTRARGLPDMSTLYVGFLTLCAPQLRAAVRILMESRGPALFHCTAGKDRTGIVAMIILGVLGAEESDIIEDYLLTRELIRPLMPFLLSADGIRQAGEAALAFLDARPAYMEAALTHLRVEHGGIREYARSVLGISEEEFEGFRLRVQPR